MRITEFRAQLADGGARSNHFFVQLTFPSVVPGGAALSHVGQFLCHAATLPESLLEDTPVMFRGRTVHFAGERVFNPWAISIFTDTNYLLRNAFEKWSNAVNNHLDNTGLTNPKDYQVDMMVHQLTRNDVVVKSYKFIDAYPTVISPIQLNYADNNVIESFDVQFVYNEWVSESVQGGINVGIAINTPLGSIAI